MSFLAPAWLAIAGIAAAGLVVVHFFARRRPRPAILPTARFVPDVAARAPSLASTPSDLLLLLVRLLAVLAIGVALARPVRTPARRPLARVVVVVDSSAATLDSARSWVGPGDTLSRSLAPSISAALVAGIRAASAYRDRVDSIELVIVSSFGSASFDAATDSIRVMWPGRARLVRVASAAAPAAQRILLVAAGDDPLRATVALLGARAGAETRVVRAQPSAADSAHAQSGGVLVHWPRTAEPGPTDTVGAVVSGEVVVVAPFARTARFGIPYPPSPIALWVDGVPAALETPLGTGCLRHVAIPVPETGDLVLTRPFAQLVDRLTAPCRGPRDEAPASDARLAALRRDGPLMAAHFAPAPPRGASTASAWLLGAAAVLLLGEMALRPRARG